MIKQSILLMLITIGVVMYGISGYADTTNKKVADIISRPSRFVMVNGIIPSALFVMKYFAFDNFVGTKVDGYTDPVCFLTKEAAMALKAVYEDVRKRGYTLKIFDCYRPQRAVDHFVRWASNTKDQKHKLQYYPNEDKSQLIKKGYIAEKSGHSRGSTIDLTLAVPTQKQKEVESQTGFFAFIKSFFTMDDYMYDAKELDMGTRFDYFDTLSHTINSRITKKQQANRLLLKQVMEKYGFVNYDKEWWHYTLKDEPYPDTYFNFPLEW